MNWFAKNGDKVFALLTVFSGLLLANAAGLGLNSKTMIWITIGSSMLTAAHTLFYPNSQTIKETSK